MQSHLRLDRGRICACTHLIIEIIQFLQAAGRRVTISCWLLARSFLLSDLLHRAAHNMAAHFFKARESLLAWWVIILCSVITYILKTVLFYWLEASQVLSTLREGDHTRRWTSEGGNYGGHPRAHIPQLPCWSASLMKVAPWTVPKLGSHWSRSLCRCSWPGGSRLVTSPTLLSSWGSKDPFPHWEGLKHMRCWGLAHSTSSSRCHSGRPKP